MSKYVVINLVSVVSSALVQILLKKSAGKQYENRIKEYLNPLVIISYGLFFCTTLINMYSLRGVSLSLNTILGSLAYVLVPLFSYFFLKERMNKTQYIGMIFIIAGIILFGV